MVTRPRSWTFTCDLCKETTGPFERVARARDLLDAHFAETHPWADAARASSLVDIAHHNAADHAAGSAVAHSLLVEVALTIEAALPTGRDPNHEGELRTTLTTGRTPHLVPQALRRRAVALRVMGHATHARDLLRAVDAHDGHLDGRISLPRLRGIFDTSIARHSAAPSGSNLGEKA